MGGYTTAKKEVIELLRQRSRPYLFSNSAPGCWSYVKVLIIGKDTT
jgi:7-keto-8-aminopelargonate synthetase-like enzyme